MSNAVKFIITALILIAAVVGFKAYKSGAFDDLKAVPQTQTNPTESQ